MWTYISEDILVETTHFPWVFPYLLLCTKVTRDEGRPPGFSVTAGDGSILQLQELPYGHTRRCNLLVTAWPTSRRSGWFTVKGFSKKNGGKSENSPKCWVWVQSWHSFERNQLFIWGFLGSWSIGNPLFSAVFLSAFRAKNSIFLFFELTNQPLDEIILVWNHAVQLALKKLGCCVFCILGPHQQVFTLFLCKEINNRNLGNLARKCMKCSRFT